MAYAWDQDWFPWWSDSGMDCWWTGDAMVELEVIQPGIIVPENQSKMVVFQRASNFYYLISRSFRYCSLTGSVTNKDILSNRWRLIGSGILTEWNG